MSDFWNNLKDGLSKEASEKEEFPEHPTEKQYEEDYTVKNDEGKPSFPIRENSPEAVKDSEDALKLLHHEKDPAKKKKIKDRACRVLEEHGKKSPSCASSFLNSLADILTKTANNSGSNNCDFHNENSPNYWKMGKECGKCDGCVNEAEKAYAKPKSSFVDDTRGEHEV